jgi:HK97 family phage prohead protease
MPNVAGEQLPSARPADAAVRTGDGPHAPRSAHADPSDTEGGLAMIKQFSSPVSLRPTAGRFSARICAFGIPDKTGDVVVAGAFTASLQKWRSTNGRIPVVFDHRGDDPMLHVGEVNPHNCVETSAGLVVSGHFYLNEPNAAKVHTQLQRGTLREWSFSALIQSSRPRAGGGRDLLVMDLIECGPTLLGKGDTQTLLVANATAARVRSPEEMLGPYRARLDAARARVMQSRA